jgi:hypothetical protein
VDDVTVQAGAATLFADGAETGGTAWDYEAPWIVSDGSMPFTHNFYVQWRNTNANGGYDSALSAEGWRYSPANTGMVMWYNNNFYNTNDVFNVDSGLNVLNDYPSFGPKGRMLVIDAHPEPYRAPQIVAQGYNNEVANVFARSSMRDAPFTLQPTVNFTQTDSYSPYTSTVFTNQYPGRPAASEFSDAFGYYPGGENVPGGPVGQTSPRWMTKQWDASVVIPSLQPYSVNAPGYVDGTRFRFDCEFGGVNNAQVLCYSYPAGLGYDGGNGNPSEVNGQYGWHVELIEEAADHSWATVRIWNARAAHASVAPTKLFQPGVQMVKYTVELVNEGENPEVRPVTLNFDPQLTYVSYTISGSASDAPAKISGGGSSRTWTIPVLPGETVKLEVTTKTTVDPQEVSTLQTTVSEVNPAYGPMSQVLTALVESHVVYLPLLIR